MRPTHALPGELDTVCVVNEAIHYGVSIGWIADNGPAWDVELRGDNG